MRIEDVIFSSLLYNEEFTRKALPHLKSEYFQQKSEKILYEIFSEFFSTYNSIPSKQAVLVEIENRKGGAAEHSELKELVGQQQKFEEKIEFLLKKTESFCKERALYNAIKESVLIADNKNSEKTVDAIPSILQQALSVCFDTSVGHDYTEDSDDRYDYYIRKESKITTGIEIFDKITKGGLSRKTLNIILAPPHGGKSMLMINFAVGALNAGSNVLYLTMEMAEEEIGRRFDCNFLNVEIDQLEIIPKATFSSKFNNLRKKAMGKLVIKEFPTGGAHVGHFKSLLEELRTKKNFTPALVVVDYMNICMSQKYKNSASANSYTTVMSIGQELRGLAIENDFALLTATQTTRTGGSSSDLDMSPVSESYGTNAIADSLFAIIDSDELKRMNQLMIKQLKNRYRDLNLDNKFTVGINRAKMKIYSLENSSIQLNNTNSPPQIQKNRDSDLGFTDFNF